MATGAFVNAAVPKSFQVTVGTTPTRLKTSSSLSSKFVVIAPAAQKIYLGDSSVASTRGIPVASGTTYLLEEYKKENTQSYDYDLAHFWAIATASVSVTVISYVKQKDG